MPFSMLRRACWLRSPPALGTVLSVVPLLAGLSHFGGCSSGGADGLKPRRDGGADLAGTLRLDFAAPEDLLAADLRGRDLAAPADLASPPTDLSGKSPCTRGAGWTAFRFHYMGSTSASIDTIGLPDRSNFQAVAVYPTTFDDALHGGGINIASGNYILIRFSLDGLTRISGATLSVYGRSYNTTTSGSFRAKSPIHGEISSPTNSVSNAWPYAWTAVDYLGNVAVGDDKGLTGIQLFAGPSSSNLIINTVELCLDAS